MKKALSLGAIIFLILSLLTALFLVRKNQNVTRDAASATTLSLLPSTLSVSNGQIFNVNMQIDTGENQVIGVQTILNFDPNTIQAQNVSFGSFIPNPDIKTFEIDNATGRVMMAVAEPPLGQARQGVGTVATISFTAVQEGNTQITFSGGDDTIVAAIGADVGVNVLTNANPTNVIVGPQTVVGTELYFALDKSTIRVNEFSVADVTIDTGPNAVVGVELYIDYDEAVLDLLSITPGDFFATGNVQASQIDPATGSAVFTIYEPVPGGTIRTGTGVVASLDFRGKNIGDGDISFSAKTIVAGTSGVNLLKQASGSIIKVMALPTATVTMTPTPIPTATLTPTPLPTATLTPTPTLTPVPTHAPVVADINKDGCVNLIDYSILYSVFGDTSAYVGWLPWGPESDLKADQIINLLDYSILFANFGEGWSCDILF